MAWPPTHPGELPHEIGIFPLSGALLLPRGKLPLNIFEPRYLALVEDALAAGRLLGMIQPDPRAASTPSGSGLYRVGCLGRLSSYSETEDGRLLITLTGVIRFSIRAERPTVRGYRRVEPDFSSFHDDLELERAEADLEREALFTALRGYFGRRNFEANWDAIRRMPDEALVITLAMVCPFEPPEKQALLEAVTDSDRAAALLALLQMGAAGPDSPSGMVAS